MFKLMRARDVTDDACHEPPDLLRLQPREAELTWRIHLATLALSSALIESALDDLRGSDAPPREKHDGQPRIECFGAAPLVLHGAKQ